MVTPLVAIAHRCKASHRLHREIGNVVRACGKSCGLTRFLASTEARNKVADSDKWSRAGSR